MMNIMDAYLLQVMMMSEGRALGLGAAELVESD